MATMTMLVVKDGDKGKDDWIKHIKDYIPQLSFAQHGPELMEKCGACSHCRKTKRCKVVTHSRP